MLAVNGVASASTTSTKKPARATNTASKQVTKAALTANHTTRRRGATSPTSPAPTTTTTPPVTPTGTTPPASSSVHFYVQPGTDAAQSVASLEASGNSADAALIEKIASQSQAIWLGEWNSNQTTVVNQILTAANGSVPVFVLYAIPYRDCGSYSSGGYTTDAQYENFVNQIAAGVQGRQAWFIVEPDALPEMDSCLSSAQQADREALIKYASEKLSAVSSHVYLDAGDYSWQSASYMAPVLEAAGVSYDAGFSLNVSAYNPTAAQESYGNQLSALIGGKHFVVDTSRNGSTIAATTWCNAPNQLLGVDPTTQTNDPLADAYLWVKSPGQSDGNCGNGAPPSGDWWLAYALSLAGG